MAEHQVRLLQGLVQGSQKEDTKGNAFHAFLGIPYAKPPIGDLRFKEPVPIDYWEGIKVCTNEGDACTQYDFLDPTQLIGTENCLNLNVYTRDLPQEQSERLKPVMVWIHGGGFKSGSNSAKIYGPEFLLTADIVLVTINYRLGLFGFLQLKDPNLNVNGNMGFKDQVKALKWVKYNIAAFNGDPNNVTIFGESAGAGSVHFHVLSPLSRGLFHKAIVQSGSALCPWADPGDYSAVLIARILEPNVKTEEEALQILKKASPEQLVKILDGFEKKIPNGKLIALSTETPSKGAFLTKKPIDILTSGEYNKVPIIFGYTDAEGMLFEMMKNIGTHTKPLRIEDAIPGNNKSSDEVKALMQKLEDFYWKSKDINDLIMFQTDWIFLSGIVASIKQHVATSPYPIYLYKMTLDAKLNFLKVFGRLHQFKGACHGDDLGYLFNIGFPYEAESIEEISINRFVKLWTNFAKYGDPTHDEQELWIKWKPVTPHQLNVLNIGNELTMEVNPEAKRLELWREVYRSHSSTAKYL